MSRELWNSVDEYIADRFAPHDQALAAAVERSEASGLPAIAVSPAQGKLLQILARSIAARSILEIGTLGGYSAIWLARGLPEGGRLLTLEADATHAEVAEANLRAAGVGSRVEVRRGRAQETLPAIHARREGPFDLIFIDADKGGYPDYLGWALRLSHVGSLIIADNVVRDGAVIDATSDDPNIIGVRRYNDMLANEPRVSATVIQTVGSKGYDGLAVALVVA